MADVMIPPWLQPQPIAQMYSQGMNTGVAAAAQQNEAARAAAALQQQAAIQAAEMAFKREVAAQQAAESALKLQIEQQQNAALMALREKDMMDRAAYQAARLQDYDQGLRLRDQGLALREQSISDTASRFADRMAQTDRINSLRQEMQQNRLESTINPKDKAILDALKDEAEYARKRWADKKLTEQDYTAARKSLDNPKPWPFDPMQSTKKTVSLYEDWQTAEQAYKRKLAELTGFDNQSVPGVPGVSIPTPTNVVQQSVVPSYGRVGGSFRRVQ